MRFLLLNNISRPIIKSINKSCQILNSTGKRQRQLYLLSLQRVLFLYRQQGYTSYLMFLLIPSQYYIVAITLYISFYLGQLVLRLRQACSIITIQSSLLSRTYLLPLLHRYLSMFTIQSPIEIDNFLRSVRTNYKSYYIALRTNQFVASYYIARSYCIASVSLSSRGFSRDKEIILLSRNILGVYIVLINMPSSISYLTRASTTKSQLASLLSKVSFSMSQSLLDRISTYLLSLPSQYKISMLL